MIPESTLLKFRSLETPFYYYDIDLLNRTLEEVRKHGLSKGYRIHYAIKANFNPELLKYIRQAGLGIDCVSGKEIEHAVEMGFDPSEIAFAGVGKTDREIQTGFDPTISSFIWKSFQDLPVLNDLAEKSNKTAPE